MISTILLSVIFLQQQPHIPEQLEDWAEWALYGYESGLCPTPYNQKDNPLCAWPSRLKISVESGGGSFEQSWLIYMDGWVPLPGNSVLWPLDVSSLGQPIAVVLRDNRPSVFLKKGAYLLKGSWLWNEMPASLPIPLNTGLISLKRDGRDISHPKRDEEGNLWFQSEIKREEADKDRLDMRVYRTVEDQIPTSLETVIVLDISGRSRELDLGNPLPSSFTAMAIDADLPTQIDENGNLKIQARAGSWRIKVLGQASSVVAEVALRDHGDLWPSREFWVFKARLLLRSVTPTGANPVDPSQTDLPSDLHGYPCFLLNQGGRLVLEEKTRGLTGHAPDQISLDRSLWLDFDGKGWTFKDSLSGKLTQSGRISMDAPYSLGRLTLNGKDQLITLAGESALPGSELRVRDFNLSGEGRVSQKKRSLPAVGWTTDVEEISYAIHLPPGWSLFGGLGPDVVEGDWLHSWRLWDFFWVLIISLAVGKMWRPSHGVLALFVLTLFHGAPGAPRFIWASILAAVALGRALPNGWFKALAMWWLKLSALILILNAIPFVIGQIQFALYPQLGMEWRPGSFGGMNQNFKAFAGEEVLEEPTMAQASMVEQNAVPTKRRVPNKKVSNLYNFTDDSLNTIQSQIQTGPGIPIWEGLNTANRFSKYTAWFQWDGPVTQTQNVGFLLISPFVNRLLALVRVILLGLMAVIIFNVKIGGMFQAAKKGVPLAVICLLSLMPLRAQEPTAATLETLRNRLLKPAECYPHCAEIATAKLDMGEKELSITMQIHAGESVGVPLPGRPNRVLVNGSPAKGLYLSKEGILHVFVEAGVHEVIAREALDNLDSLQLGFPLKPHRISFQSSAWKATGLDEEGKAESQLVFSRIGTVETSGDGEEVGLNGGLTPFAEVHRTLNLQHQWTVSTAVFNNYEAPFIAQIPLLEGEKVLAQDIRISENQASISLDGKGKAFWSSNLETVKTIVLTAPSHSDWRESWALFAGSRWHVEWEGTPIIKYFEEDGSWFPTWEPRPGESLELHISRPAPAEGQVNTIDQTHLSVTPGKRVVNYNLELRIRSSLGGDHGITLPEGAVVDEISVNSVVQSPRFEEGKLILLLNPGLNNISIEWSNESGLGLFFKPGDIRLGQSSVNNNMKLQLPKSRWLIWVSGPQMGPAVRFWSLFVVLVLASWALAKAKMAPLKIHQWLLLGLGLCQLHVISAAIVAGWFLLLGWRKRKDPHALGLLNFNLLQVFLVLFSLVAVVLLLVAVNWGLLGSPNMYVSGNGSSGLALFWYQERSLDALPGVWVFSLPLFVYRLIVLVWALWLAASVLSWGKWGWSCFSSGAIWRDVKLKRSTKSGVNGDKEEKQ